MKLTLKLRVFITLIVTLLICGHLVWDYFHGGIPTHYIFQNGELPGIPNWLGGIILPFFTWFLLNRISKRVNNKVRERETFKRIWYRFVAGALVSISIAICFTKGIDAIDYIMLVLFILAFFIPLYKSEYLLGYVLGASFSFGAFIPVFFGSILALLFFVFYKIAHIIRGLFGPKTK